MDKTSFLPAFSKNNVPVVLASSAHYVPYMATTIQSIIQSSSPQNNYDIIVVNKSIPAEDKQLVCSMAEGYHNISIRFLRPDKRILQNHFNYRSDAAAAPESFYCVLMHEILPAYEKVICIDCDVVVLKDIAKLYATDVSGFMIAACRDCDGIGNAYADALGQDEADITQHGRAEYMLDTMRLKTIDDYFQSGVMLLNLAEFRKAYTIDEILNIACADYIIWGDQDSMNILCRGRVEYLDLSWNLTINHKDIQLNMLKKYGPRNLLEEYDKAREAPKIIHYAGMKPWKVLDVDLFPYFWKYASCTPYYEEISKRAMAGQIGEKTWGGMDCREVVMEQYRTRQLGLRYMRKFLKAWWVGKTKGKSQTIELIEKDKKKEVWEESPAYIPEKYPLMIENGGAPVLSVIVPCHNVEHYLKACIESILWQSFSELEILLIDDCSSDKTAEIMQKYKEKYPNIRAVYLKEKLGPSGARNMGIEMSKGKYIAFCDADDTVPLRAYEMMLQKAEESYADIVVGDFLRIYESGHTERNVLQEKTSFDNCLTCGVVWNKLFRKSLIDSCQVRFDSTIRNYEDLLFSCQLLLQNPHIETVHDIVYNHLEVRNIAVRQEQLTYGVDLKRMWSLAYMLKSVFEEMPTHHLSSWRRYYVDQLRDSYKQIWMKLTEQQEREEGFLLLKELVLLGEKKHIYGWEQPEAQETFYQIFQIKPDLFEGMPFESYMLYSALREHSYNDDNNRRENQNEFTGDSAREETLRMFREGKIGFKYVIKYAKAWLRYKLLRHS